MGNLKQQVEARKAKASQKQQGSDWSYNDSLWTNAKSYKSQQLDIEEYVANKAAKIMFGKPIVIESINKEYQTIADQSNLQWDLHTIEHLLSKNGHAIAVIQKRQNGSVDLSIADPNFPNKVVRFGKVPYQAVIWRALKFDRTRYYVKEIYDYQKVVRYIYTDVNMTTEIPLDKFNAELPEDLQIAQEETHGLGFLPVIELHRKPVWDYSEPHTAASLYKFNMQETLNETTTTLRLENENNRTRIILDQGYVNGLAKHEQAKVAKSDIIIKLDATGKDPKEAGKAFEVIKGDPQFRNYWDNINNIFRYALEYSGYSDLSDSETHNNTATAAIFTKANDLETSNDLIKYRIKSIKEILIKMFYYKHGIKSSEQDLLDDGLVITIHPNIIFNEMNMTQTLVAQRDKGWITDEAAISRINGISLQDAKQIEANASVETPQVEEPNDLTE